MIPFFRKIRKKMADENKPMKYTRYAIGEIVLVVIGILIALQINTWNEERKTRIIETKTLKEIRANLEMDLVEISQKDFLALKNDASFINFLNLAISENKMVQNRAQRTSGYINDLIDQIDNELGDQEGN